LFPGLETKPIKVVFAETLTPECDQQQQKAAWEFGKDEMKHAHFGE
jgi:hypothetical protein